MLDSGHVICFSGRIASGKSTLSKEVATELSCPWVSFGEFVRRTARERGLDSENREVLQNIGEELLSKDVYSFCNSVLNQVDWKLSKILIVDGVRHLEVHQVIKELVKPKRTILVYIDIDNESQAERAHLRGNEEIRELKKFEKHSTEQQLPEIACTADYVLDGKKSINYLKNELLNKLLNL